MRRPQYPLGHTQVFRTRPTARRFNSKVLGFSHMTVEIIHCLSSVACGQRPAVSGDARPPYSPGFFAAQSWSRKKFTWDLKAAEVKRAAGLLHGVFEVGFLYIIFDNHAFLSRRRRSPVMEPPDARHNSRSYRKAIRRLAPDGDAAVVKNQGMEKLLRARNEDVVEDEVPLSVLSRARSRSSPAAVRLGGDHAVMPQYSSVKSGPIVRMPLCGLPNQQVAQAVRSERRRITTLIYGQICRRRRISAATSATGQSSSPSSNPPQSGY